MTQLDITSKAIGARRQRLHHVNVADYNGDGRLDVAGPDYLATQGIFPESPGVSVLLQVGAPCLTSSACTSPLRRPALRPAPARR